MNVAGVQLLYAPDAILKALMESKSERLMIGLHSPALGNGIFITCIDDIIISDDEPCVVTVGYDITGHFLPTKSLALNEVIYVLPFISVFENPFLKLFAGNAREDILVVGR